MVVVALFRVTIALIFLSFFLFWDEDWQPPPADSDHPTDGPPSIRARPMQADIIIVVVVIVQHRSEATVTFPIF